MAALSQQLKKIREDMGLTQVKMAKTLGIAVSSWNWFENGKAKPPTEVIKKLCKVSGLESLECDEDEVKGSWSGKEEAVRRPAAEEIRNEAAAPAPAAAAKPVKAPAPPAPKPMAASSKAAAAKEAPAKEAPAKEEAGKRRLPRAPLKVYIQSSYGGEISVEELREKVLEVSPRAERIYVKPDENRAYWTKGSSSGTVVLWE